MFKFIRNWLRAIITEEVIKVAASLARERNEAVATFRTIENEIHSTFDNKLTALNDAFEAFKPRVDALLEMKYNNFVVKLRDSFRDAQRSEVPSTWQASEKEVAEAHELRKPKK
jgi:recombinational DNA repair ATPase RecF